MSDNLQRMEICQIGLQTTTDFVTPPTFTSLEPQAATVTPMDTERNERDLYRGDNQDYASAVGIQMLEEIAIDLLLRGVASNDGGPLNHLTATEVGIPLDACSDSAGIDPSGAATTTSADTGASAILNVTDGSNCANGGGVMFQLADGSYVAREQVSKATNALTLDRTWTDGLGSDTVLYRSVHWAPDPSVSMHKHVGIRGKGQHWECTYLGCGIMSWSISGGEGKPLVFQTKWKPSTWSRTSVSPSFSAPSAGNYVMNVNSRLFIANDSVMFKSWSIDGGLVVSARETASAQNGINGFMVTRKSPTLKGRSYFGNGGLSFGEIADTGGNITLQKIQSVVDSSAVAVTPGKVASVYDCAVQAGAQPGSCLYARLPALELSGKMVADNGVEMIDWLGKARRPASGMPMRIHLF